jgi:hypothetical protein
MIGRTNFPWIQSESPIVMYNLPHSSLMMATSDWSDKFSLDTVRINDHYI